MKTYSFKSVGTTRVQSKSNELAETKLPVGIPTPVRPADDGSLLQRTYSISDQVGYNLRDMLMTNHGERLALYDYGANLRKLCSEFQTQNDFDTAAIDQIRTAVSKWMPYVELENYVSDFFGGDPTHANVPQQVKLRITYSVPQLNITQRALEITLRVM